MQGSSLGEQPCMAAVAAARFRGRVISRQVAHCSPARAVFPFADMNAVRILKNKIHGLQEANPMLGLRGCRLGIRHPGKHAWGPRRGSWLGWWAAGLAITTLHVCQLLWQRTSG